MAKTVGIALSLWLLMQGSVAAQSTELALDFRPVAGVLSIAWQTSPTLAAGVGLGGGIDELGRTLQPSTTGSTFHNFEQILHLSAFLRQSPSQRLDLDYGLRGGIGSIRQCTASDCWPGVYAGAYANAFWGGRRWKLGPRLIWAVVRDSGHSDGVLYLEIVTGRISWSW